MRSSGNNTIQNAVYRMMVCPIFLFVCFDTVFAESSAFSEKHYTSTNSVVMDGILPWEKFEVAGDITQEKEICWTSSAGPRIKQCRPYAVWRRSGEKEWLRSSPEHLRVTKNSSEEWTIECSMNQWHAAISARRLDCSRWELNGRFTNRSQVPIELARFHYLHGAFSEETYSFLATSEFGINSRMFRRGERLSSPRHVVEKERWGQWGVLWKRLPDPIHDESDWGTSLDTGFFSPGWNEPGWFFGFTGPGKAFGEIGFKTTPGSNLFYAGVLLDGVLLEPGETRNLENLVIGFGDLQENLRFWACQCAKHEAVSKQGPPLVGYCSWYQNYREVTPEDILRAAHEFVDWPISPGGRTIQIDDGYQKSPGDWRPNEKFQQGWESLPGQIAATGSIPGLWLAPTAVHESNELVKKYPEWLQRLPNGEPAISMNEWGKTYFLEIDHPGAREFMRQIIRQSVCEGWRYLKIDFAYFLATDRVAYDRRKTSFESLRDLFALFREAAGPEVKICACVGGVRRYVLGQAEIVRVAGDIAGQWTAVRQNLADLFLRMQTNGVCWQADPDVFYMRRKKTTLNEEENHLLTGTLGLLGGVFLTSDFPSQWSLPDRAIVSQFWTALGPRVPADQFTVFDAQGNPRALRVSYDDGRSPHHAIAIYNYKEEPKTSSLRLAELRLREGISWAIAPIGRASDVRQEGELLAVPNQPPHSVRIFGLTKKEIP